MKRKITSMLLLLAGTAALTFAPAAFAQGTAAEETTEWERQPQERYSYSVRVYGERKNHRTTIGLEDPETAVCLFCGKETDDVTRVYTGGNGFEETDCDTYAYGTDVLYHYLDFYQGICHDCPSVGNLEGSVLQDQTFTFEQERTLIFCEGRSHI